MKAQALHHWLFLAVSVSSLYCTTLDSRAALLVQEAFDYTADSDLSGQGGGTGFAAGSSWAFTNTNIVTWKIGAGLGMTGVANAGSSSIVTISNTSTNAVNAYAGRQLASTVTSSLNSGTTFGSFLFQVNTAGNQPNSMGAALLGGATATDNTASFFYGADPYGSFGSSVKAQGQSSSNFGNSVATNVTYLYLFEQNAITGTINAWVLTEAQYTNFSGSLTAASLNAATQGTGNNNVFFKGSATAAAAIGSMDYLRLVGYVHTNPGINGYSMSIDEFRLSDTSLLEAVTAVPEPTVSLLAGLASIGFLTRRRRNAA